MRRLAAALGVLLGGLGVVAGLVLLAGAWWARGPVTAAFDDGAEATLAALARVDDRLVDMTTRFEQSRAQLRAIDARLNTLVSPSPELLEETAETLRQVFEEGLEPMIARTTTAFGSANPFVESALTLLEAADRLAPLGPLAGVDVAGLRRRVSDLQDELDALPDLLRESEAVRAEALRDLAAGRAMLLGSSSDIDRYLTSVRDHLTDLDRDVDAVGRRLDEVRAGLPRGLLVVTAVVSGLLLWWIVAQYLLYASSLEQLRR